MILSGLAAKAVGKSIATIFLGPIIGIVEKYLDKQANKDNLKAEIEQALIGAGTELAKLQADVVTAEIRGDAPDVLPGVLEFNGHGGQLPRCSSSSSSSGSPGSSRHRSHGGVGRRSGSAIPC